MTAANGTSVARVLHVLEAVEGGTARHLVDVVRHARGTRHVVAIPARRSQGVTDDRAIAALRDHAEAVHLVPMRRSPLAPSNAASLVRLARLVRRERPDVVHAHSSIGGTLGRIAARAAPGIPVVYTPNGVVNSRSYLVIERALGPWTTTFVAVSASEGELVRSLRLVRPGRIAVIPNGIDLDRESASAIDLRRRLGLPAGTPLVGTIARLVPQKAPELFVRAAAHVARRRQDVHFVLIGSGPLQDAVDREVRAAALGDRFHQLDSLPGASAALAQLDAVALLSRFEGGPYTPLEAMRAGVPVVLTDVVGNRDAIEDRVSGRIVPFGDACAAGDAIVEVLDDREQAAKYVDAARFRLRALFDVRAMGCRLDELYRELTASERS